MDLEARPFIPKGQRVKRLPQHEWQLVKDAIHEESGYVCHYCERRMTAKDFVICDHLTPLARGGDNSRSNLVTACDACNTRKGMLTEAEFTLKGMQSSGANPHHKT
jgi:5-methylcytosine-specific restriction endonuclease McrA